MCIYSGAQFCVENFVKFQCISWFITCESYVCTVTWQSFCTAVTVEIIQSFMDSYGNCQVAANLHTEQ